MKIIHKVTNGVIDFITPPLRGLEAFKQNLLCRLRSFKGDCYFNLDDGIDYGYITNPERLRLAILDAVDEALEENDTTVEVRNIKVITNRVDRTGKFEVKMKLNNQDYSVEVNNGV